VNGWTLAIDFGTTFTTAATARNGQLGLIDMAASQGSHFRMPSAVWVDQDGEIVVGWNAESQAPLAPDRLERAPKQLLGDDEPMQLGRPVTVEEAVGAVLGAVFREAVRQQGGLSPDRVILTHPASWPQRRKSALLNAGVWAGIQRADLLEEPIGAAVYFTGPGARGTDPVVAGGSVAVYDLGGGTFDTAVLRRTGDGGFEPIGVGGRDGLGGEVFDTRLSRHLRTLLLDSSPKDWHAIERSPRALQSFRREVRIAKEALSVQGAYDVVLPEVAELPSVRVTRDEFERLVEDDVLDSIAILEETCRRARVDYPTLDGVFLVGGSSRIPLVGERISQALGRVPDTRENPKAVVALGAAAAGAAMSPAPRPSQPTDPAPEPPGVPPTESGSPVAPVSERPRVRRETRKDRDPPRRPRVAVLLAGVAVIAVAVVAAILVLGSGGEDQVQAIRVAGAPIGVTVGGGSVWTANESGTVSRIPIESHEASTNVTDLPVAPSAIDSGEGSIWVMGEHRLDRIDPANGKPGRPIALDASPYALATGFGAVWLANGPAASVTRVGINPSHVPQPIDVGHEATEIATGKGGVWIVSGESDTLQRLDPGDHAVGRPIDLPGAIAHHVAVGAGGVWVASEGATLTSSNGTLSRVDATTRKPRTVGIPGIPAAIAVGEGAVWVLADGGVLRRFDPSTLDEVGDATPTTKDAQAIAVGGGGVWVADTSGHRILRIAP
jgi:actin-like ATPase involved in cell morphogenesis